MQTAVDPVVFSSVEGGQGYEEAPEKSALVWTGAKQRNLRPQHPVATSGFPDGPTPVGESDSFLINQLFYKTMECGRGDGKYIVL